MKRNIAIFFVLTLLLALIHPALGETVLAQVDTETMSLELVHSKTVRIINDEDAEVHEPGEWSGPLSAHFNYVGYDKEDADFFEDESVLQFDLSSVSNKKIVSAVLKVDVYYIFTSEWGIWASNENVWSRDESIPEKTQLVKSGTHMDQGVNYIDVTSFFESELYGADQKATFVLSHIDPSKKVTSSYFAFYTMGLNGETHPKQPVLEVTYLANQPPTGQIEIIANEDHFVNHRNVFLQVTGEDPDGDALEVNISNSSIFVEEEWKPFESSHRQKWELTAGDGLKTVYMQLRDEHGNRSVVHDASVILDTTKPTGSITINNGAEYTTNPNVTLVIEGIDDHGVAQMRFSNQAEDWSSSTWVPYATTHGWTLDASDDGEKMVYMLLQDKAGNISDLIISNRIILDTKAPKGTLEINGGATHTKDIQVYLTLATDDDSEIEFIDMQLSNNNRDWTEWIPFETSKEWSLTAGEGQKTVYLKLRDRVGNESEEEISAEIYLDITPPTGSVMINGGSRYTNSRDVKLSVSADDGNGVGKIQVQLSHDDQIWSEDQWLDYYNSTEEYDWQLTEGDGEKFVYMKLRDGLGNESTSAIKSDFIILDTIPPTVTGVADGGIYNVDVTIAFNEDTATLNGASFVNGATVSAEGSYILIVTDAAGNVTEVKFEIDKTPPVVTGVVQGGIYNTDVTISFNEGTAMLNGSSFLNGGIVSAEDNYSLIVTDAAGNVTEVKFEIDKTPPTGTVSINNGTGYTNTLEVTLQIEGEDSGTSNAIQLRLSNSLDTLIDEEWEPFSKTKSWTLDDNGMSEKTVYMQLRDEAGNVSSLISSAPITYKSIPVPLASTVKGMKDEAFVLKKSDFIYTNADVTELHSIKIALLPADGELSLGNKKIDLDQVIIMSELDQEDLIFTPNHDWFGVTELAWKAGNGYEFSDVIGNISIEVLPAIVAPTDLVGTPGDGVITLKWTGVSDAARYNAIEYRVYQSTTAGLYDFGSPLATVTGSVYNTYSYQSTGLTNGTTYYFVVTAYNDGRESDPSNEVSATPHVPSPGAPILQSPVAGNAQVGLAWDPVDGATGYKIFYSQTTGKYGAETATVTGDVYGYNVTGLTNGTAYYFVVKAENPGGLSEASNEVSATPMTVPTAPTDVKAVAGNGIATISFNVPRDNGGSQITGYEVSDQQGNVVTTGDSSPMTITGLTNGKSYRFTVKAINRVGKSMASEPSNEIIPKAPSYNDDNGGSGPPMSPPATKPKPDEINVDIIVNGQVLKAGIAITEMINNQQVTTITVDADSLEQKLAEGNKGFVISIPWLNAASDVVIGNLSGQMVKGMEQKEAVVELITTHATYILPAQEINIDALAEQFGNNVALQDIEIQIEISTLTTEQLQFIQRTVGNEEFSIVVPPLNFTVKGVYKGNSIGIYTFNAYVERTITIPNGVDPSKITTAIVIESDGMVRHVPTKIEMINSQYAAIINSLSNSTYTLIWNPIEFQDVADHWAKDAINNMGARKVVNGIGDQSYRPDQDITRAEFAAIIVRALGLKIEKGTTPFTDVKPSDWYSGVVQTAYAHNLINGFDDGTFRPNDNITREQAMVIISKAMEITKLSGQLQKQSPEQLLSAFNDAAHVSTWAKSGIADSIQAGIVTGRSNAKLASKEYITRAEVAVIIQRLLQKSGLI